MNMEYIYIQVNYIHTNIILINNTLWGIYNHILFNLLQFQYNTYIIIGILILSYNSNNNNVFYTFSIYIYI